MTGHLHEFLPLLACPACRVPLELEAGQAAAGWLHCRVCATATPVLCGMVLFTEACSARDPLPDLDALAVALLGDEATYADYQRDKFRRKLIDAYAAFEPFNEATRCLTPLLEAIGQSVAPGDAVLDLGNRAGWSGAMLAGRFPRQKVISVCGTGSGVLGYRGYRHWFCGAEPAANLLLVFASLDGALPVRDAAFALVHSHDRLHRCADTSLFDAALRAAGPAAPVIHAHIHLAEPPPEPFFERGGILRPVAEYRQLLASRLSDDMRVGRVLSESAMFRCTRLRQLDWADLADESGCNGVCVIALPALLERASACCRNPAGPEAGDRLLSNPLLRINPLTGAVRIDAAALGGRALEMLDRHPPFAEQLRDRLPDSIDASAMALLRRAAGGATLGEIALALGLPSAAIIAMAGQLASAALVVAAPVSLSYQRLHAFHYNNVPIFDTDLPGLLREWARHSPDGPGGLLMDAEITRTDALAVVSALVRYLGRLDLGPEPVVAFPAAGADALWPLLACLCLGARPVFTASPAARLAITDHPDAAWPQQLCLAEAATAVPVLGEVLAAYLAIVADPLPDFGPGPDCPPAADWDSLVRLDGDGRLQRRCGTAATDRATSPSWRGGVI